MAIDSFGIQFAKKVARRVWQKAITPAVSNTEYEGDIKQAGDRVRIIQFLDEGTLQDYVAGTDMSTETLFDDETELVVEKRKAWNFPIDRLEDLFMYADDAADSLVESRAMKLEREIDSYVLEFAQFARAGNWVGINLRVAGSTTDTSASIATTAAGGTLSIFGDAGLLAGTTGTHAFENQEDGVSYFSGFTSADAGKPVRLTSGRTWATPWYRISAVTDSVTVSVTNWDGAAAGSEIPNGDILRGLGGGQGDDESTYAQNTDGKVTTEMGWGYEMQAAGGTAIAASAVYEQVSLLSEKLDKGEVSDTDRHLVGPPQFITSLRQASELQTAVNMAYEQTILNGKVMRILGFDVHEAAGARVSNRAAHATASGTGASTTLTTGTTTYQIPAMHKSFVSFAYKWAESRIVDAENQFAKKYQGLHLYGAVVPLTRRRTGAVLFGTF